MGSPKNDAEMAVARAFVRLPRFFWSLWFVGRRKRNRDRHKLDPRLQLAIRMFEISGKPKLHELPPQEARELLEKLDNVFDLEPVRLHEIENRSITGPASALPIRIYRPQPGLLPALLFYHGGGFVTGNLDMYDATLRSLAKQAEVTIVSVDYRLAPEHPFPAAVEDARAAYRFLMEQGSEIQIDPQRVAIAGDSAGGNLAAGVAQYAHDEGLTAPALQVLLYPGTDLRRQSPSHDFFQEGFFLDRPTMDWFMDHYLQPEQVVDPRASPLLREDPTGLAPALVVTAGFDPLLDEGKAYADALGRANVAVEYACYEEMMHGFFTMGGVLEQSRQLLARIATALQRSLR